MALPFLRASKAHAAVRDAAGVDIARAGALWGAITTSTVALVPGSFAEAVADTAPEEHLPLLVSDEIAAAWAFDAHWRRARSLSTTIAPFEQRIVAREVWATFAAKARSVDDVARGFGWDLSLAWRTLQDVETRGIDAREVLAIAKLAGRMYAALRGAAAKRVANVPTEVYSVEQGNDVGRLLPAELAQLTDEVLETAVLERVASNRAMQFAMRGTAPRGRGPLVVCLDESGSMHAERRRWSKAAAIALARVALDERRPMSVVHYSTSTVVRRLDLRDAAGVVAMIRSFLNGGTAIGLALETAVAEVQALAAKGAAGADIILISDGVDGDERAQAIALDKAKAIDARLWLVAIECEIGTGTVLRDRASGYARLGADSLSSGESANVLSGATAPRSEKR